MSRVIIELDDVHLSKGYATVIKVGQKGRRRGVMTLPAVVDLFNEIFKWETARRSVRMLSRFDESGLLAFGQNGVRWMAVADIPPAEYLLVGGRATAYAVKLPRLIVKVSNQGWPWFYWTDAAELTPQTTIYPLLLSNVYDSGYVCLGTTGLKCKTPDDIRCFVRQVIEAPGNHMLGSNTGADTLYERLERDGWDPSIGKKHGITLSKLIAMEE